MAVSVWGQVYGVTSLMLEAQIPHTVLGRFDMRSLVLFSLDQHLVTGGSKI